MLLPWCLVLMGWKMSIEDVVGLLKHEGCPDSPVVRVLYSESKSSMKNVEGVELSCVLSRQHNLAFEAHVFKSLAALGFSFRVRCCEPDPEECVYMHVFLDGEPQWHVPDPDYWDIHLALEGGGLDNDKVVLIWRSRAWLCFVRREAEVFDIFCGTMVPFFKSGAVAKEVYEAMCCKTPIGRVSWLDDGAEIGEMFSGTGIVTTSDIERVVDGDSGY